MQKELASLRLDDQVAIVTGAGSGIGRKIARAMASVGAHVVIVDVNEEAARCVATEIGGSSEAVAADVTNEVSITAAVDAVARKHGRIDVLFNNAGVNRRKPSTELTLEDWNFVLSVNMTGMFLCARAVARHMISGSGGRIVNTASILGMSGGWYPNIAYQASKGAVINMTRSWAVEWAPRIRVNAIAPGIVHTPLTDAVFKQTDQIEKFTGLTLIGRLGTVEDMVGPVLFLASNASAMVTGHILPVDGGMLVQ